MGNIDFAGKQFFKDNHIFAELINLTLLKGTKLIDPNTIVDSDTEAIFANMESAKLRAKYRDIFKQIEIKADNHATYMLIGIENQAEVDYTMPIRALWYDAMVYNRQREEAMAQQKAEKGRLSGKAEFLTGVPKGTRFKPIITLVLYLSGGRWDGPRSLHDNLYTDVPEVIAKYINNWHIPIIEPLNIPDDELESYTTELGLVLKFLKYCHDKDALMDNIKNDDRYSNVSSAALGLMNSVSKNKINSVASDKGGFNMCKGIDDLIQDSVAKGKEQGIEQGLQQGKQLGLEQGLQQGEAKKAKETALTMSKKGLAVDFIAECIHVSKSTVEEWLKGAAVL